MELEQDFFVLFGLPRAFAVAPAEIKRASRRLLLQYHPDKLVNATPHEKRLAEQFSAHINHAKSILADPVKRASHLFDLCGFESNFDNRTIKDRAFLMQQMMMRESFEEAEQTQELEELSGDINKALEEIHGKFDAVDFNADKVAADSADELEDALAKMHFFEKFAEDVRLKRQAMQAKSN